jgi:hypothetical protein
MDQCLEEVMGAAPADFVLPTHKLTWEQPILVKWSFLLTDNPG